MSNDRIAANPNVSGTIVTDDETDAISSPQELNTEIALAEHAAVIRALGKRVVADIIEIGRRLTAAKEIAGHGYWLPWLDREFGWGDDTALRYMQVGDLSKSRNLRDLSLPISGLYLLAAPSTPEEARADVMARAENGERLSVRAVKEIVAETRRRLMAEAEAEAREAEIRAEYLPRLRKPPAPENPRDHWLQFLRTKYHPVTKAWRLMHTDEFAGLVEDIKAHGQVDPIKLIEYEGEWVILDGRCREIACGIAGVEPTYEKIEVDDPAAYVLSVHLDCVSLNPSQRAMADAMLSEPDEGEKAYDHDELPPLIVVARYVHAHAPKLYVDAVINGTMCLDEVYERVIDGEYKARANQKKLPELERRRLTLD